MKNTVILAIIMCISQITLAQEQSEDRRDIKKNEISIDPITTIALGALGINYERIITNNTSVGIEFFYQLNKKNNPSNLTNSNTNYYNNDDDWILFDGDDIFNKEIALTVNYKYFFGDRVARGFYIGGFGRYSSGKNEKSNVVLDDSGYLTSRYIMKEFSDFALGFNVGGKFVAKNGFFLDISFGIGRNLFDENSPQIIVKPNVYLGYRF